MRIDLVRGDITELAADAIVNAANEQLRLGSGVAGAIRAKGGPTIQTACNRLAPIETGAAVATTAGTLPYRYIIHAVAPHVSLPDWEARLERAIVNIIGLAESLELRHVALPALGTGVFGLPLARSARIMLTAAHRAPATEHLETLTFCLYDDAALRVFEQALQALLEPRSGGGPPPQQGHPHARRHGRHGNGRGPSQAGPAGDDARPGTQHVPPGPPRQQDQPEPSEPADRPDAPDEDSGTPT